MAPHIALHEIGAPFESRPLSFHGKENRDPAFLAINPEGKVPTLADRRPAADRGRRHPVLSRSSLSRRPACCRQTTSRAEAQVVSWMSFIAATIHPARRQGLEHSRRVYAIAEQRLGEQEWAVGRYSIADIHLFRLFWRFRGIARCGARRVPAPVGALRAHDGTAGGAEDHRDRGCDRLRTAGVARSECAADCMDRGSD